MAWFRSLNTQISDWQGRRGWIVGASGRLRDVAEGMRDVMLLPLDVTDAGAFTPAMMQILDAWGGLDLVILNAGTYTPLRAWDLTTDTARQTVHTNLLGVMDGVAAVVPQMLRQQGGAIAIVGSVAGYRGLPRALAYGPSKAALINFAETLYLDLAPEGVSVFIINPGFVATPLSAQNDFDMPALISAEDAARRIVRGFAGGAFEIHFPQRFTRVMKLLRWLPDRLYFSLVSRGTRP